MICHHTLLGPKIKKFAYKVLYTSISRTKDGKNNVPKQKIYTAFCINECALINYGNLFILLLIFEFPLHFVFISVFRLCWDNK